MRFILLRVRASLAIAIALPLAGCWSANRPVAPHAGAADWRTVDIALCEDYPEETRTLESARRDLELARAVGAKSLRIAFGWDAMEPARGDYDWSFWDAFVPLAVEQFGLRLIPYVCYTPEWAASEAGPDRFWRSPPRDPAMFQDFVAALTTRYGRWIDS